MGQQRRKVNEDALALALAGGTSVSDAAARCGVCERTAYRRLRDDGFRARVAQLRGEMVTRAAGKLADAMAEAVDVLRALLKSDAESVRLRAADRMLEIGTKVVELHELQRRVEELERRQAAHGDGGIGR